MKSTKPYIIILIIFLSGINIATATTGTIEFDTTSYTLGEHPGFYAHLNSPDYINHRYEWYLFNPANSVVAWGSFPVYESDLIYSDYESDSPGVWKVELYECVGIINCDYGVLLASDTTWVLDMGYGVANFVSSSYAMGEYANVSVTLYNPDHNTFSYKYDLIDPTNHVREIGQTFLGDGVTGYDVASTAFDEVGTWTVHVYACTYNDCINQKYSLDFGTTTVYVTTGQVIFDGWIYSIGDGQSFTIYTSLNHPNFVDHDYAYLLLDPSMNSLDSGYVTGTADTFYNIHEPLITGIFTIQLIECEDTATCVAGTLLDSDTTEVINTGVGYVLFINDPYHIGDNTTIEVDLSSPDFGNKLYWYELVDPNSSISSTGVVDANYTYPNLFSIIFPIDQYGTWTIDLYECSTSDCGGTFVRLARDTTVVVNGSATPTPTPTPTSIANATSLSQCTGDSLLDATGCLSEQIFGLHPDAEGHYTTEEIKATGNRAFSTLLLLCLVCICIGIYNYARGTKKGAKR